MAISNVVFSAQDILKCQLCETNAHLSFKCVDCNLLLCTTCRQKVHSKIKDANRHTIVEIQEVGRTEFSADLDFRNIPCISHPEQFCCLYCQTCEKVVCATCVAKEHAGHNFIEIKDIYTEVLNKLTVTVSEIEVQEQYIDTKEKEVIGFKQNEMELYSKVQKELENKRQTYKNDIDAHFDRLAADVKVKIDKMQKSTGDAGMYISDFRKGLTERKRRTETLLSTRDAPEFFNSTPALLPNIKAEIPIISQPQSETVVKFVPTCEKLPGELLGTLNEENKHATKKNLALKIKKQYTTELVNCHFIVAGYDGSYFIAQSNKSQCVITKVNIDRDGIKTIFTKKVPLILDLDQHKASTDIVFADRGQTLKVLNGSAGDITESQFRTRSLLIIAMHVTMDNNIVVGARSSGDLFPVQGRRVVIVMDSDGKHQAEWEYNQQGYRRFSLPRPSASVENGNVFVNDVLSIDCRGQVITLSPSGNVLYIYAGHSDINNKQTPFTPFGMTRTPSDNVIVCDFENHTLHLLNNIGVPLSYFSTLNIGIKYPYCVTFDTEDNDVLFIGCTTSKGSTQKGNLYKVNFTEF